ncbi:MAG: PH domain-containing protein [Hamadaea sp.]|uniref:PH domain-containing protein n=1 Tax=Hamadaea sp. TaxID=2024425 RepID=UPI0017EE3705|nr:PH domain-containing protein [Hamadaea sp.]NUR73925.1 PH domain-containing protein [Hamadaea sp.]NUT19600.1 PH domain-containing protein [Hamadaea sp.]
MTSTAVRWCALPLALLAFLLRLAAEAGWYGPGERSDLVLGAIVPLGVPGVAFVLLAWWAARRATFTVDRGVFVVPASPVAAGLSILCAVQLAELVPTALPGEAPGIVGDGGQWAFAAILGAPFLLVGVLGFAVRRPRLVLDSAGVTIQHLFRRHTVGWDEIAYVRRINRPPTLRLVLDTTAVFGLARESADIAVGWLFVNPDILQVVIEHYVGYPEERSAVGSAEEAARIRAYAEDQAAWA